jgi:uncharacterized protein (TIGR00290 family)
MEYIACSWSGGKDSCFALMQEMKKGHNLRVLVNMMNENGMISRSHGLPLSMLQQQAESMNVPLIAIPTSWPDYEFNFTNTLLEIKNKYGVRSMVFGDIDLQAHRDWEEKVCYNAGLFASLPLWKQDRKQLVKQMLQAGIQTIIVSCNDVMGEDFLGKLITESLILQLDSLGVDVCGENGEFHTLVIDCPLFRNKIYLPDTDKIKHEDYWFLQWHSRSNG